MQVVGLVVQVVPAFWRAHWSRGGQGFEASGPAGCWRWSSCGVFPAFCLLYRSAVVALLAKYAFIRILRVFLARFGVVAWVCIACVLCVACGAFVRV